MIIRVFYPPTPDVKAGSTRAFAAASCLPSLSQSLWVSFVFSFLSFHETSLGQISFIHVPTRNMSSKKALQGSSLPTKLLLPTQRVRFIRRDFAAITGETSQNGLLGHKQFVGFGLDWAGYDGTTSKTKFLLTIPKISIPDDYYIQLLKYIGL